MKQLSGIAASQGVAVGPAFVYRPEPLAFKEQIVQNPPAEINRLIQAVEAVQGMLVALEEHTQRAIGEKEAKIFEVHRMFLADPSFADEIKAIIREERLNAEAAVDRVSNELMAQFSAIDDDYFRQRVESRLARELGIDLAQVVGTGPDRRIQSHDIRQAAEAQAAGAPAVAPAPAALLAGERAIRRQVPLTQMRRVIAERLTASVRDIPQFTVSMKVEMGRALEVVADLRRDSDEVKVTLSAFLVKACAWALGRHPALNASFGPEAITEWADINIGVAVSVAQGLLVPVIRQANQLSTLEITAQIANLGQRARDSKLQPQEMQGGTFTLSNLGMFGMDHFTAIINPPEAVILAISRVAKVPVVSDDERVEIKQLASFTLTADHRLVDGAKAAQFLGDLKKAIEYPGILL